MSAELKEHKRTTAKILRRVHEKLVTLESSFLSPSQMKEVSPKLPSSWLLVNSIENLPDDLTDSELAETVESIQKAYNIDGINDVKPLERYEVRSIECRQKMKLHLQCMCT
jgi:hypothetical protein